MAGLKLSRSTERQLTNALIHGLSFRPDDWSATKYRVTDGKTGAEIWVSNGRFALHLEKPVETTWFRFWNRRRLWSALRPLLSKHDGERFEIIERLIGQLNAA